ncbi:MAG: SRPBCC domain-containing protein [Gimesia sp.]
MVIATDQNQTSLRIERSLEIAAPLLLAYESLLEQLGPAAEMPDGTPMPMKLEPWPGGRWYRDLGEGAGHFWGTVQVIKPPTLIEINGPLFMSYPVMSHIQYRLIEKGNTTTLQFLHQAIGLIDPSHAEHVVPGWEYQLGLIKQRAEQTA